MYFIRRTTFRGRQGVAGSSCSRTAGARIDSRGVRRGTVRRGAVRRGAVPRGTVPRGTVPPGGGPEIDGTWPGPDGHVVAGLRSAGWSSRQGGRGCAPIDVAQAVSRGA